MQLDQLATEARHPRTHDLDRLPVAEVLALMNDEDAGVPGAVRAALPRIAAAVELAVTALRAGGRLIYLGAGTSGRIGLLDAVECPPTFGIDPDAVMALLAGGAAAFGGADEGVEDEPDRAVADLDAIGLTARDVVVGLAASGRTPYVVGGLRHARAVGAATVAVACNPAAPISAEADVAVEVDTGPEVLTGSTRLKAGTAQKLVCNMLSTATMIALGKVYANLMVDVRPTNAKLVHRARRIVVAATGADEPSVDAALREAGGNAKTAVVMLLAGCPADAARARLHAADGRVRAALDPTAAAIPSRSSSVASGQPTSPEPTLRSPSEGACS